MNEASVSKVALGGFVHIMRKLITQLLLGIDGIDLVNKALQIVIPVTMLLHEGVGFAAASGARGEDQNVALRTVFLRGLRVIQGLDHDAIVNGRPAGNVL